MVSKKSKNIKKQKSHVKNNHINKPIQSLLDLMHKKKCTIKNGSKTSVNKIKNKQQSISPASFLPKKMPEDDQFTDKIASLTESEKFLQEHNIKIATITINCKLHALINLDVFAKNVDLYEDGIVSVKFGKRNDPATNRTIVIIKPKKKPSTKNFYNQVTILMKPTNNPDRNYINIKVFKNGSLQITGCKDLRDFTNVTNTLIKILVTGKIIDKKKIQYVNDANNIGIHDVKIRMINSGFKLDYKIDRKKLKELLKANHGSNTKDTEIGFVEYKYKPNGGHSCVNIKYQYDEDSKPSIFVFQTGSIIITGAKKLNHIIMAYHFINKILAKYYNEIRIINLDPKAVQNELAKFYQKRARKQG